MRKVLHRRQLLGLALGLAVGVAGGRASTDPYRPSETSYWQFTGQTRCNGSGYLEERWCYYECVGRTCDPMYCEWRMTGERC
jgi:hypothetical protein